MNSILHQLLKTIPRRRRTLFNVPGNDERKLLKAHLRNADTLVLDLEDGVAISEKQKARNLVGKYLESDDLKQLKIQGKIGEVAVRINSMESAELAHQDLKAISAFETLDTIVLPKADSKEDVLKLVKSLEEHRDQISSSGFPQIIPCMESAKSLLNLKEIASCDERVKALVFASEDFCANTGITRTSNMKELLYARSKFVSIAKAFDLQAIDLVCIDFKNLEKLKNECIDGKNMGFDGKQAIHPTQIPVIHEWFEPSSARINESQEILKIFIDNQKRGIGAFDYNGKVVDMPVVKEAAKTLVRANAFKDFESLLSRLGTG